MIVVDSSAVVAIMRGEPEARVFTQILDDTTDVLMSVVSLVETNMVVVGRRLDADTRQISLLIDSLGIKISEVTIEQAHLTVETFLRYGKGRHRASLNLADCFCYALAKSRNVPLLYKGGDFAQTDIAAAWRP